MMRLFFGLALNDEARGALESAAAGLRGGRGRLHGSDNYHLTLVFLGATPTEAAPQLLRIGSLAMRTPFELTLAPEMGTFKNDSIVWAGVEACPALFELRERLSRMLRENGFPGGDEPFVPHITLGRGMKPTLPLPTVARASFPVNSVTLFRSLHEDGRLVYRPVR